MLNAPICYGCVRWRAIYLRSPIITARGHIIARPATWQQWQLGKHHEARGASIVVRGDTRRPDHPPEARLSPHRDGRVHFSCAAANR